MIETTFVYDAFDQDKNNTIRAIVRDQSKRVSSSAAAGQDYAVVLGTYKPAQAVGSKMQLNFGEEDGPFSSTVMGFVAKGFADVEATKFAHLADSLHGLLKNIHNAKLKEENEARLVQ